MQLKDQINELPKTPGVYIYRNRAGKIIYVGKAVNLRSLFLSYFVGAHDTKTTQLVREISSLETKQTASALEALILEANLIKKHQPVYNIREKDDKSYLYLWISKEEYPRVAMVRGTELHTIPEKNPRLFGPYTSGNALKSALEILRPALPYRSCKKMPAKACLYGYLGLCDAPCVGKITPEEYKEKINELIAFLRGKRKSVVRRLEKQMKEASKNHEYEKAANLRDRVRALQHINDVSILTKDDQPTIYKRIEGYDISNIQGVSATGSMVVFVDGSSEKSEYRKFKIRNTAGANDTAMMAQVLTRRAKHDEWPKPDLIVIDGGEGQLNAAATALAKMGWTVPMVAIAKGPQRKRNDFRFRGRVPERSLRLFKQVRDESHRFAIGYYRKLHRKSLTAHP